MIIIENWFSTQLFVTDASSELSLAKKACTGLNTRDAVQQYAISNNGITTYPNDSVIRTPEYAPILLKIEQLISEVAVTQMIDMSTHRVCISEIWANEMLEGSEHAIHSHVPSHYSGCFYVDCPDDSAPTRFYNPIFHLTLCAALPVNNSVNYGWVDVPASEGKVVIWNGWLAHNVPVNQSKTPRRTISFNAFIHPIEETK